MEPFTFSYGNLIAYNERHIGKIHYTRSSISFHATARNELVQSMRGEWLLQLDTDIYFEPDLLHRMLRDMENYNMDVLTGLYVSKKSPHRPVLFMNVPNGEGYVHVVHWEENEPFMVDAAGAGCLLVKRKVFDRIIGELGQDPFDVAHPYSEDTSFFRRCKTLGIGVWCDPRIQVYHLGITPFSSSDIEYDKMEVIPQPFTVKAAEANT